MLIIIAVLPFSMAAKVFRAPYVDIILAHVEVRKARDRFCIRTVFATYYVL